MAERGGQKLLHWSSLLIVSIRYTKITFVVMSRIGLPRTTCFLAKCKGVSTTGWPCKLPDSRLEVVSCSPFAARSWDPSLLFDFPGIALWTHLEVGGSRIEGLKDGIQGRFQNVFYRRILWSCSFHSGKNTGYGLSQALASALQVLYFRN